MMYHKLTPYSEQLATSLDMADAMKPLVIGFKEHEIARPAK
jgi:hypothetical protein